ncbi:hypothetical protein Cni_G28822 [Canna indica]|uniref:Uncharacterized protein n=1 Tax=Canna indica TaxID=4628 RepID=A0AAQ3L446_9LILI|nr:hypothetical protein Cni_G28822 [Canna indica]
MNRGVGGPLLCIGDLLSDVADDGAAADGDGGGGLPLSSPSPRPLQPSGDLHQVFEDNYDQLIQSLDGNDHSWTALTLKLCAALKTADKLVTEANSNGESLLEKVESLESIIKRGDSAVSMVKSLQSVQIKKGGSLTINSNCKM